jgi:hypothetical protein
LLAGLYALIPDRASLRLALSRWSATRIQSYPAMLGSLEDCVIESFERVSKMYNTGVSPPHQSVSLNLLLVDGYNASTSASTCDADR